MTLEQAVDILARHLIAGQQPDWEDYPEIGENDWEAVLVKMDELTPDVDPTDFADAYEFLTDRAEGRDTSDRERG